MGDKYQKLLDRKAEVERGIEKARKRLRELSQENDKIRRQIKVVMNQERLRAVVGKPGAVLFSHQCRDELSGKPATVLKVNRTRAIAVVVNHADEWDVPFDFLIDAQDEADDIEATEIASLMNQRLGGAS